MKTGHVVRDLTPGGAAEADVSSIPESVQHGAGSVLSGCCFNRSENRQVLTGVGGDAELFGGCRRLSGDGRSAVPVVYGRGSFLLGGRLAVPRRPVRVYGGRQRVYRRRAAGGGVLCRRHWLVTIVWRAGALVVRLDVWGRGFWARHARSRDLVKYGALIYNMYSAAAAVPLGRLVSVWSDSGGGEGSTASAGGGGGGGSPAWPQLQRPYPRPRGWYGASCLRSLEGGPRRGGAVPRPVPACSSAGWSLARHRRQAGWTRSHGPRRGRAAARPGSSGRLSPSGDGRHSAGAPVLGAGTTGPSRVPCVQHPGARRHCLPSRGVRCLRLAGRTAAVVAQQPREVDRQLWADCRKMISAVGDQLGRPRRVLRRSGGRALGFAQRVGPGNVLGTVAKLLGGAGADSSQSQGWSRRRGVRHQRHETMFPGLSTGESCSRSVFFFYGGRSGLAGDFGTEWLVFSRYWRRHRAAAGGRTGGASDALWMSAICRRRGRPGPRRGRVDVNRRRRQNFRPDPTSPCLRRVPVGLARQAMEDTSLSCGHQTGKEGNFERISFLDCQNKGNALLPQQR